MNLPCWSIATTAKAGDNSISAVTSYTYDIFGNRLTVDGPVAGTGDTVTYKYDALRRLTGMISPDPDGAGPEKRVALRYSYTGRGDLTQQETGTVNGATDPDFAAFVMSYRTIAEKDNVGRTIRNRTETGATTYTIQDIIYDSRGRVACTMQRMNPASWAANATSCTPTQTTGPQGPDRVYRFTYDEADTLIATEDGYGTSAVATVQRYFTKNGRLSAIVDANNNRTNYAYDGYDRLWKTYFPNPVKGSNDPNYTADFEQLTYNGNSIVTNKRLRDGSTINYGIDELNRMISMGGPVADRTYTYNQLSQPLAVTFSTGGQSVSWQYDGLGRAITETQPYGSIATQYDLAGNVKRLTWADGFYVDYDRDDAYRVTKIRENGATTGVGVLAQYAYDSLSRQSSITYGNGTTRTYAYDPISRLSGLQINLTGTAADQTIGQVGGTGTPISYNAASQIASITKSNDAYAYTARTNVSRSYTTNGLNQYTSIGATTLDHDQRGNLTRNGAADYVYSKLNELTTAGGLNLNYDPVGRLMQINLSTTTRNYYAGSQLAAEVNTSGTILRRFVPGVGDDAPIIWYEGSGTTNRKFLQADERGSIVAVSDSSGNSIAINSYDEYGASASTGDGGRFRYTGQIWYPEIGLYNYKARFYSPLLGRFMQTDPIGYDDGMNLYAYAGNNPVNATDPSGLAVNTEFKNQPVAGAAGDPLVDIFVDGRRFPCMACQSTNPFSLDLKLDAFRQSINQFSSGDGKKQPGKRKPQKMEPCSGAQKAGQWLGDNVGKVGSLATNLGLTATTAGGGLVLAGMGQIGRGNFVGGLRTGMLGFIAMEKGAELTGVGGLITAGGGVISAVSGSGKPATVEGLTRFSTSLLPSGQIKDFASEAISKGLDAIIPDIRSCAP